MEFCAGKEQVETVVQPNRIYENMMEYSIERTTGKIIQVNNLAN